MKKAFLSLALIAMSLLSFANDPCNVLSGYDDLKAILKEKASMQLVVDWSETTYDFTQDVKKVWKSNYDWIVDDCEKSLISGFNEESKGLKLTQDTSAKYKCELKVTNVDQFRHGLSGRYESKMWGNLKIFDAETEKLIVEIDIEEAEDGKDTYLRQCYGKTFYEFGITLAKLK